MSIAKQFKNQFVERGAIKLLRQISEQNQWLQHQKQEVYNSLAQDRYLSEGKWNLRQTIQAYNTGKRTLEGLREFFEEFTGKTPEKYLKKLLAKKENGLPSGDITITKVIMTKKEKYGN